MNDEPIICLVRDLLFYSKIRTAAAEVGIALKSLRDPKILSETTGRALIVDLNQEGALAAASAWRVNNGLPVLGFVSHVDTETITAARAAGIDRVLARSQFDANLPGILKAFTV